jgi:hypothetical protein
MHFRFTEQVFCAVLRQTWRAWPEGLDKRSELTHSFRTSPQNFPLPREAIAPGDIFRPSFTLLGGGIQIGL